MIATAVIEEKLYCTVLLIGLLIASALYDIKGAIERKGK